MVVINGRRAGRSRGMKRIVESTEVSGFEAMLGEKVCLFCGVYVYAGKLTGVNDDHIELSGARIVYETGELTNGPWKDAQDLPSPWRVMLRGIESWGKAKC